MFDINTLTTLAAIALFVATWAVVLRLTDGADAGDLARAFGTPWEPRWPRGVQEEEPFHWHLDGIARPSAALEAPERLRVLPDSDERAEEAA